MVDGEDGVGDLGKEQRRRCEEIRDVLRARPVLRRLNRLG